MRSMTRDEVVDALVAHPESPYRRETLSRMTDDEVAAAANSAGLSFDELQAAANRGGSAGVEVEGILADPPSDDDASSRNRRAGDRGDLATLRRTFSPLATDEPAENVGDADVEVRAILSGPRGDAAVDGDEARREARGRREAAEGRREREQRSRRGEVPVEPRGILSGRRGESALDDD